MKLDYVNALRGLAILGVIAVHTSQYGIRMPKFASDIAGYGAMGVQLFFVASAFTLMLSIDRRSEKQEKYKNLNFYIRRFFRIAPMYYLGLVYYFYQKNIIAKSLGLPYQKFAKEEVLSNLLFYNGVSPYWINNLVPGGWSITVEMTFYGIILLVASKVKTIDKAIYFFIFTILIRTLLMSILEKNPLIEDENLWRDFLYLNFFNQLPVFAVGIFMYFLIIKKETPAPKTVMVFTFVFILALLTRLYTFFPLNIIFAISFLMLGYSLSKMPLKIIVNPVVNYIGKISFSLYLIHFAVLFWLNYFKLMGGEITHLL